MELQVIEQQGQRVLTTKQISNRLKVDQIQLTQNFNNNKKQYIEGIDYFLLKGEDLKAFKSNYLENFDVVGKRTPSLYLWTESGFLMHVKSINTDEAWKVYREVIDTYFRMRETIQQQEFKLPQTYKEALLALIEKVEENEKLESENKMMLPKAQTYDRFIEREESLRNIGVVAKELGDHWGEKRLYHFLRAMGVLFKQSGSNVPKQQYMKYFEVKETVKNNINCAVTLVKPEGHEFIMRLVEEFEEYLNGEKITYNSIDAYVKIKAS